MKSVVKLIVTVTVLGIAMGSYLIANRDEGAPIVTVHASRMHAYARWYAYPDFVATLKAGEYVTALRTAELHDALEEIAGYVRAVEAQRLADARQAELERIAAYVRAQHPVPVRPPAASASAVTGGGGCCTQEQFARLAQCESGGVNGWRTGLYGIEAGYPIGGLSVADQQAWVMRIYAAHGPSAWGCSSAF